MSKKEKVMITTHRLNAQAKKKSKTKIITVDAPEKPRFKKAKDLIPEEGGRMNLERKEK